MVYCNDYYIGIGISITKNTLSWNVISITAKMGFCPFFLKNPAKCPMFENNYGNAPILKFDFLKSSFKCKTRFLEHRVIANVDLEFFFLELEFHELEYFTWYSSSWNSITNFFLFFFLFKIFQFTMT